MTAQGCEHARPPKRIGSQGRRDDPSARERPVVLPRLVAFGDHRTLVVGLLAASQCDLHLGAAVLDIHPGRHDGHALDAHGVPELADLALVQQQPPLAAGLVVEAVGLRVRRNVGIHQPGLAAILHVHVGLCQADLPQRGWT